MRAHWDDPPRPARTLLVAVALSVAGIPGAAAAQDGEGVEESPVDALVREGVALRQEGDEEGALARFEEAYALSPEPRILAQRGLTEQALGRFPEAHAHLTEALEATDDPFIARYRGALQGALESVRGRIGRLELTGGVPGATVQVNGEDAGTLPLDGPIVVPPGEVVVDVAAEGYVPMRRIVVVSRGGLARESLVLVPRRAPTEDDPDGVGDASGGAREADDTGDGPNVLRILAWTSAGLAVAAGGGAIGALIVRENAVSNASRDACLDGGRTRGENCGDDFDRAEAAETAGIALVSAAGVFAITSVVLFAISGGDDDDTTTDAASSCGGGPGLLGVSCAVRF